ncbi:reverse transcriptase [Tanacetum coccineum]
MAYVSSVTFSFNINGQVLGHVAPTRGLLQVDPISPYLFITCVEVSSSMIRKSVTQVESCRLKIILDQYCKASREVINYKKLEISFSANVEQHVRSRILESLSVREVAYQTKYLGLPSIIDRSKKVVFKSILDRIKRKLRGWKEETLSIARKELLIKSVTQAMPIQSDGAHGKECVYQNLKEVLGLFNRSLHAKQVWRLITSLTTLAGNGRNVNMWEDFWLADHKILGPKPYNSEVNYVCNSLNNEGDDWNYKQLASLFPSNIANKIACSFVCQSWPDSLYWYNSPRGELSCKSTYLLDLETSQELVQNNSDEAIKIFHAIWMAMGLNLITTSCTHCGETGEDVLRVLFRCSKAKEGLCTRQNKHFHGQAKRREVDVEVMAKRLLLDYLSANKKEITRREGTPQTSLRDVWTKPQVTQFKFNCDATWQKESGKVGMGFAIQHARSRCYYEVVFESDSLTLVHALRNQSIPLQIAVMFSDNLSSSLAFRTCDWSFVKREGNMVAYSIARWALGCTTDVILKRKVPSCAYVLVLKDIVLSVH